MTSPIQPPTFPEMVQWVWYAVAGDSWPEANEAELYRLAEHWETLASALREGQPGLSGGIADVSAWYGGTAGQELAFAAYDVMDGLRQLAESAVGRHLAVRMGAMDIQLTKYAMIMEALVTAIAVLYAILSSYLSFGISTASIPGLVGSGHTVVTRLAADLVRRLGSRSATQAFRRLSRQGARHMVIEGVQEIGEEAVIAGGAGLLSGNGLDWDRIVRAGTAGFVGGVAGTAIFGHDFFGLGNRFMRDQMRAGGFRPIATRVLQAGLQNPPTSALGGWVASGFDGGLPGLGSMFVDGFFGAALVGGTRAGLTLGGGMLGTRLNPVQVNPQTGLATLRYRGSALNPGSLPASRLPAVQHILGQANLPEGATATPSSNVFRSLPGTAGAGSPVGLLTPTSNEQAHERLTEIDQQVREQFDGLPLAGQRQLQVAFVVPAESGTLVGMTVTAPDGSPVGSMTRMFSRDADGTAYVEHVNTVLVGESGGDHSPAAEFDPRLEQAYRELGFTEVRLLPGVSDGAAAAAAAATFPPDAGPELPRRVLDAALDFGRTNRGLALADVVRGLGQEPGQASAATTELAALSLDQQVAAAEQLRARLDQPGSPPPTAYEISQLGEIGASGLRAVEWSGVKQLSDDPAPPPAIETAPATSPATERWLNRPDVHSAFAGEPGEIRPVGGQLRLVGAAAADPPPGRLGPLEALEVMRVFEDDPRIEYVVGAGGQVVGRSGTPALSTAVVVDALAAGAGLSAAHIAQDLRAWAAYQDARVQRAVEGRLGELASEPTPDDLVALAVEIGPRSAAVAQAEDLLQATLAVERATEGQAAEAERRAAEAAQRYGESLLNAVQETRAAPATGDRPGPEVGGGSVTAPPRAAEDLPLGVGRILDAPITAPPARVLVGAGSSATPRAVASGGDDDASSSTPDGPTDPTEGPDGPPELPETGQAGGVGEPPVPPAATPPAAPDPEDGSASEAADVRLAAARLSDAALEIAALETELYNALQDADLTHRDASDIIAIDPGDPDSVSALAALPDDVAVRQRVSDLMERLRAARARVAEAVASLSAPAVPQAQRLADAQTRVAQDRDALSRRLSEAAGQSSEDTAALLELVEETRTYYASARRDLREWLSGADLTLSPADEDRLVEMVANPQSNLTDDRLGQGELVRRAAGLAPDEATPAALSGALDDLLLLTTRHADRAAAHYANIDRAIGRLQGRDVSGEVLPDEALELRDRAIALAHALESADRADEAVDTTTLAAPQRRNPEVLDGQSGHPFGDDFRGSPDTERLVEAYRRAESIPELEALLTEALAQVGAGPGVTVSLAGVALETAREHAEAITRAALAFPHTPLTMVFASEVPVDGGEPGLPFARSDHLGMINFDSNWAGPDGRHEYLTALEEDVDSGWLVSADPLYLGFHEFAHQLHNALRESVDADIRQVVRRHASDRGEPEAVHVQEEVSGYAADAFAEDVSELIAEAFADVAVNGESASPLSVDVVAVLVSAYRDGPGSPDGQQAEPDPTPPGKPGPVAAQPPGDHPVDGGTADDGEAWPPLRDLIDNRAGNTIREFLLGQRLGPGDLQLGSLPEEDAREPVTYEDDGVTVRLGIYDGEDQVGVAVGTFGRDESIGYNIRYQQAHLHHDLHQRRGFATTWHQFLEDWARATGVSYLSLTATGDGAYVAARFGFDFDPIRGQRAADAVMELLADARDAYRQEVDGLGRWLSGEDIDIAPILSRHGLPAIGDDREQVERLQAALAAQAAEADALLARRHLRLDQPGRVSAHEISQAGRGRQLGDEDGLWLGKRVLLDTSGVPLSKRLDPDGGSPSDDYSGEGTGLARATETPAVSREGSASIVAALMPELTTPARLAASGNDRDTAAPPASPGEPDPGSADHSPDETGWTAERRQASQVLAEQELQLFQRLLAIEGADGRRLAMAQARRVVEEPGGLDSMLAEVVGGDTSAYGRLRDEVARKLAARAMAEQRLLATDRQFMELDPADPLRREIELAEARLTAEVLAAAMAADLARYGVPVELAVQLVDQATDPNPAEDLPNTAERARIAMRLLKASVHHDLAGQLLDLVNQGIEPATAHAVGEASTEGVLSGHESRLGSALAALLIDSPAWAEGLGNRLAETRRQVAALEQDQPAPEAGRMDESQAGSASRRRRRRVMLFAAALLATGAVTVRAVQSILPDQTGHRLSDDYGSAQRVPEPSRSAEETAPPTTQPAPAPVPPEPETFTNPVFPHDHPDPAILQVGEWWYAYSTAGPRGNVPVIRSRDLVNWEMVGDAMPQPSGWSDPGYWAPEVIEVDGRYLLYYTGLFNDSGSDHALGVAVSDRPEGPFVDPLGQPLVSPYQYSDGTFGVIDASPFRASDGRLYLTWKTDGTGNLYGQELSPDGLSLVGEPRLLLGLAQAPAWVGPNIEGQQIVEHGGRHYLFFSGNEYFSVRYAVGYVVSDDGPMGPYHVEHADPILASSPDPAGPKGPGHGFVFKGPDGQWGMAFHAWGVPYWGHEQFAHIDPAGNVINREVGRTLWFANLMFDPTGVPQIIGPATTVDPQQAPRQPGRQAGEPPAVPSVPADDATAGSRSPRHRVGRWRGRGGTPDPYGPDDGPPPGEPRRLVEALADAVQHGQEREATDATAALVAWVDWAASRGSVPRVLQEQLTELFGSAVEVLVGEAQVREGSTQAMSNDPERAHRLVREASDRPVPTEVAAETRSASTEEQLASLRSRAVIRKALMDGLADLTTRMPGAGRSTARLAYHLARWIDAELMVRWQAAVLPDQPAPEREQVAESSPLVEEHAAALFPPSAGGQSTPPARSGPADPGPEPGPAGGVPAVRDPLAVQLESRAGTEVARYLAGYADQVAVGRVPDHPDQLVVGFRPSGGGTETVAIEFDAGLVAPAVASTGAGITIQLPRTGRPEAHLAVGVAMALAGERAPWSTPAALAAPRELTVAELVALRAYVGEPVSVLESSPAPVPVELRDEIAPVLRAVGLADRGEAAALSAELAAAVERLADPAAGRPLPEHARELVEILAAAVGSPLAELDPRLDRLEAWLVATVAAARTHGTPPDHIGAYRRERDLAAAALAEAVARSGAIGRLVDRLGELVLAETQAAAAAGPALAELHRLRDDRRAALDLAARLAAADVHDARWAAIEPILRRELSPADLRVVKVERIRADLAADGGAPAPDGPPRPTLPRRPLLEELASVAPARLNYRLAGHRWWRHPLRYLFRARASVEAAGPPTGFAAGKELRLTVTPRGIRARSFTVVVTTDTIPAAEVFQRDDGLQEIRLPATSSVTQAVAALDQRLAAFVEQRGPDRPTVLGENAAAAHRRQPREVSTVDVARLHRELLEPLAALAWTDSADRPLWMARLQRIRDGLDALGLGQHDYSPVARLADLVLEPDGAGLAALAEPIVAAVADIVGPRPEPATDALRSLLEVLSADYRVRRGLLRRLVDAGVPGDEALAVLDLAGEDGGERSHAVDRLLAGHHPGVGSDAGGALADLARLAEERSEALARLRPFADPGALMATAAGLAKAYADLGLAEDVARRTLAGGEPTLALEPALAATIVEQLNRGPHAAAQDPTADATWTPPTNVDLISDGVGPDAADRLADLYQSLRQAGVQPDTVDRLRQRVAAARYPGVAAARLLRELPALAARLSSAANLAAAFEYYVDDVGAGMVRTEAGARWALVDPWVARAVRGVEADLPPAMRSSFREALDALGVPRTRNGVPGPWVHMRRRGAYALVGGFGDFTFPALEGQAAFGIARGAARFVVTVITGGVDRSFKSFGAVARLYQTSPTRRQTLVRRLSPAAAAYAFATGAKWLLDSGGPVADVAAASQTPVDETSRSFADASMGRRHAAAVARARDELVFGDGPPPPAEFDTLIDDAGRRLADIQQARLMSPDRMIPDPTRQELAGLRDSLVRLAGASEREARELARRRDDEPAPRLDPPRRTFVIRRMRHKLPTTLLGLGLAGMFGPITAALAVVDMVGGIALGLGEASYQRRAADPLSGLAAADRAAVARGVAARIDQLLTGDTRKSLVFRQRIADWRRASGDLDAASRVANARDRVRIYRGWPRRTSDLPPWAGAKAMPDARAHWRRAMAPAVANSVAFLAAAASPFLSVGGPTLVLFPAFALGWSRLQGGLEWWYAGTKVPEALFHYRQAARLRDNLGDPLTDHSEAGSDGQIRQTVAGLEALRHRADAVAAESADRVASAEPVEPVAAEPRWEAVAAEAAGHFDDPVEVTVVPATGGAPAAEPWLRLRSGTGEYEAAIRVEPDREHPSYQRDGDRLVLLLPDPGPDVRLAAGQLAVAMATVLEPGPALADPALPPPVGSLPHEMTVRARLVEPLRRLAAGSEPAAVQSQLRAEVARVRSFLGLTAGGDGAETASPLAGPVRRAAGALAGRVGQLRGFAAVAAEAGTTGAALADAVAAQLGLPPDPATRDQFGRWLAAAAEAVLVRAQTVHRLVEQGAPSAAAEALVASYLDRPDQPLDTGLVARVTAGTGTDEAAVRLVLANLAARASDAAARRDERAGRVAATLDEAGPVARQLVSLFEAELARDAGAELARTTLAGFGLDPDLAAALVDQLRAPGYQAPGDPVYDRPDLALVRLEASVALQHPRIASRLAGLVTAARLEGVDRDLTQRLLDWVATAPDPDSASRQLVSALAALVDPEPAALTQRRNRAEQAAESLAGAVAEVGRRQSEAIDERLRRELTDRGRQQYEAVVPDSHPSAAVAATRALVRIGLPFAVARDLGHHLANHRLGRTTPTTDPGIRSLGPAVAPDTARELHRLLQTLGRGGASYRTLQLLADHIDQSAAPGRTARELTRTLVSLMAAAPSGSVAGQEPGQLVGAVAPGLADFVNDALGHRRLRPWGRRGSVRLEPAPDPAPAGQLSLSVSTGYHPQAGRVIVTTGTGPDPVARAGDGGTVVELAPHMPVVEAREFIARVAAMTIDESRVRQRWRRARAFPAPEAAYEGLPARRTLRPAPDTGPRQPAPRARTMTALDAVNLALSVQRPRRLLSAMADDGIRRSDPAWQSIRAEAREGARQLGLPDPEVGGSPAAGGAGRPGRGTGRTGRRIRAVVLAGALVGAAAVGLRGHSVQLPSPQAPQPRQPVPESTVPEPAPAPDDPVVVDPPEPAEPADQLMYTVVDGDWMRYIAERYLGDERRFPEIAALNPAFEQRSPDDLRPGDQLVLPAGAWDRGERLHAGGDAGPVDANRPAEPRAPGGTPASAPAPDGSSELEPTQPADEEHRGNAAAPGQEPGTAPGSNRRTRSRTRRDDGDDDGPGDDDGRGRALAAALERVLDERVRPLVNSLDLTADPDPAVTAVSGLVKFDGGQLSFVARPTESGAEPTASSRLVKWGLQIRFPAGLPIDEQARAITDQLQEALIKMATPYLRERFTKHERTVRLAGDLARLLSGDRLGPATLTGDPLIDDGAAAASRTARKLTGLLDQRLSGEASAPLRPELVHALETRLTALGLRGPEAASAWQALRDTAPDRVILLDALAQDDWADVLMPTNLSDDDRALMAVLATTLPGERAEYSSPVLLGRLLTQLVDGTSDEAVAAARSVVRAVGAWQARTGAMPPHGLRDLAATAAIHSGHDVSGELAGLGVTVPDAGSPVDRAWLARLSQREPWQVAWAWRQLTDGQAKTATEDHPRLVGNLDGLPTEVRDRANRGVLARARAGADWQEWMDLVADRLSEPDTHLKGLDVEQRTFILAMGNPDVADNVLVYMPGAGTVADKLDYGYLHELYLKGLASRLQRTEAMAGDAARAAPGHRTAVVYWQDYKRPRWTSPTNLPSSRVAAGLAAPRLRRFTEGQRVTGVSRLRQVVIGHSYGHNVLAATARDGIRADATVGFGGPPVPGPAMGWKIDAVRPERHVWEHTAAYDPMRLVSPRPSGIASGVRTIDPGFHALVFAGAPGSSSHPVIAHLAYWDPGNLARLNVGWIVTGQYDKVILEGTLAGAWPGDRFGGARVVANTPVGDEMTGVRRLVLRTDSGVRAEFDVGPGDEVRSGGVDGELMFDAGRVVSPEDGLTGQVRAAVQRLVLAGVLETANALRATGWPVTGTMVRMLLELTGSMQVLTGGGPTVRATLTYDPDSGEHVMGVRLDPRWDATLNAPRASTVADVASSVWHEAEHALRLEQEPPDPLAGVDALRVQDLEVAAHEAERLFLGWLRRRVGKAVLSADLEAAAAWNAELTEAVVRLQTHPNGSRYLESAGRPDLDGRLHLHSSAGRDDDQPYRTVPAIRGSSLMPAKQLVMPTTEEPGQVLRHLATMTGSPVGILGPIDAIETEQDGAPAVLWEVEMPGLNLVTLAVRVGDPRVLLAIRDTRDDPAPAVAISREVGGMLEVVLAPWLGIPEAMEVLARQLGEAAAPVLTTTIGLRADDRFVGEVFQLAAFLELHGLVRDGQARVTDIEPGLAGDLEARLYGFKLRGPGSIERWELARSILPEEFGDVLAELAATGEEHYRLPGLTTKVERELRGLEAEVRKEILDAIRKLQYEPRPNGAIKLTGLDLWRIKVQRDYRVVYGIDDQSRMVSVEAVRHRSTGYGHL